MVKRLIIMLALVMPMLISGAAETSGTTPTKKTAKKTDSEEGKVLFQKVYNMIFGTQGSSFGYEVNIAGLYKTKGFVAYHGKKQYYDDSHATVWEDGVTSYQFSKKKKVVNIYSCNDPERNKWMNKFKFEPDKFTYSCKTEGEFYILSAKLKKHSMFGLREIVGKVYKKNLYPVSMTAKLPLIQAVVTITNFHSGVTDDAIFVYPREKYKSYEVIDNR